MKFVLLFLNLIKLNHCELMEHTSIERLARLIRILARNTRHTVAEIAKKLETSERTAYRYILTLKIAGVNVIKRFGSVYAIDVDDPDIIIRKLGKSPVKTEKTEKAESGIILQRPCQDLKLARDTYQVLEQMDELEMLDDAPYLQRTVANVTLLQMAAENGKRVTVTYDSNRWGRRTKRVIEPYDFFFYYNFVWCFDHEKQRNMPLRISRMGEVTVSEENCLYTERHRKQIIDAFGCWGHYKKHIRLRLSMQARNLMTEAHPLSMIDIKEDPAYPDGERWILDTGVCDYSGLTRYIMGMLDEVEILEGDGLKEYIQEWRTKIMAVPV